MAEFTRDTAQPGYIQYLPLIVFIILIIIQIIYCIVAMSAYHCRKAQLPHSNNGCGRGTAMVIGIIIGIIILILLIWVIYYLCHEGWFLSAWFIVLVLLILSVLMNMPRHRVENDITIAAVAV